MIDVEAETLETTSTGEESFRRLVFRTYRLVLWYFLDKGLPKEDAEDLAQDTYLAAFRGLGGFRRDAEIEHWLLKIAANRWRNWLRHRLAKKRAGFEIPLDSPTESGMQALCDELVENGGPFEQTLDAERLALVRRIVAGLPRQMRHCAALRFFHGLSYREVADALGISVNSVRVQLFRARRRIGAEVGAALEEPASGKR